MSLPYAQEGRNIDANYGQFVSKVYYYMNRSHRGRAIYRTGPDMETLKPLMESPKAPLYVREAIGTLQDILRGKIRLSRDERIRKISEIYQLVFWEKDTPFGGKWKSDWTHSEFMLLVMFFEHISLSPFNKRMIWSKWNTDGCGWNASRAQQLIESKDFDDVDGKYMARLRECFEKVDPSQKSNWVHSHVCLYEARAGLGRDEAMDYINDQEYKQDDNGKFIYFLS